MINAQYTQINIINKVNTHLKVWPSIILQGEIDTKKHLKTQRQQNSNYPQYYCIKIIYQFNSKLLNV